MWGARVRFIFPANATSPQAGRTAASARPSNVEYGENVSRRASWNPEESYWFELKRLWMNYDK